MTVERSLLRVGVQSSLRLHEPIHQGWYEIPQVPGIDIQVHATKSPGVANVTARALCATTAGVDLLEIPRDAVLTPKATPSKYEHSRACSAPSQQSGFRYHYKKAATARPAARPAVRPAVRPVSRPAALTRATRRAQKNRKATELVKKKSKRGLLMRRK